MINNTIEEEKKYEEKNIFALGTNLRVLDASTFDCRSISPTTTSNSMDFHDLRSWRKQL